MRNKEATEIMVDVFGALGTDLTQNLLVEKILRADRANPTLIVRLMTHIVGMDEPPVEVGHLQVIFCTPVSLDNCGG